MWSRFPLWLAKHRRYLHLYTLYGEFRTLLLLSPIPSPHVSHGPFCTGNSLKPPLTSSAQFEQEHTFPLPSEEKEHFKHKAAQIFQNPSEKLMASLQFCSSFMVSLANSVSEPKEQGMHAWELLVHGPQLRFLDSGPP